MDAEISLLFSSHSTMDSSKPQCTSSRIWRTHWSYMGPLFNSPARRRDSLSYLDDFHSGCRWGYCRVPDWRNESVNWSSDGERPIEERTTIFPPGSVSSCPKR